MKNILIVEDEESLREAITLKVADDDHQVTATNDGKKGLATALSDHPDVILLDILLPGLNGIEFLNKLREDPWGKTAKVVVLTNMDSTEDILKGLQQSVQSYFVKSDTDIDLIAKTVRELA